MSDETSSLTVDVTVAGGLVLFGGWVMWEARDIGVTSKIQYDTVGASALPLVLGGSLAALGVILALRTLIRRRRGHEQLLGDLAVDVDGAAAEETELEGAPVARWAALTITAVCVLYAVLLPYVGFLLSTLAAALGIGWIVTGKGNANRLFITAAVTTAICYLFFIVVVDLRTPVLPGLF